MVTSPGKGSPDTPVSVWRCIGKKFRRRLNVQGFGQDELIARPRGFQIRDHLGVTDKIVDKFGFNRQLHRVLDLESGGLCRARLAPDSSAGANWNSGH
jgi:hypothetical protein